MVGIARLVEFLGEVAPARNVRLAGAGYITTYWEWQERLRRHTQIPNEDLAPPQAINEALRKLNRGGVSHTYEDARRFVTTKRTRNMNLLTVDISRYYESQKRES
jgi:hypothetical protein